MTDLPSLLSRLEASEGADRELDAELAVAFSGDPEAWVVNPSPHSIFSAAPGWWRDGSDKSHDAPAYTTSVDAALALVERVLPGREWIVEGGGGGSSTAVLLAPFEDEGSGEAHTGRLKTPALALLAALLKALITKGEGL